MKKLLFSLFSIAISLGVYGQCTPNANYTSPGIYPPLNGSVKQDSIYVLPSAALSAAYSQTIDLVIPADTTIVYGSLTVTADIDSMRVIGINNKPGWLNYACNNSTCGWAGGAKGCLNFYGTAPNFNNTWLMEAEVEIFADLGSFGQVVDTFSVWIEVASGTGLGVATHAKPRLQVGPNPMSSYVMINYVSATSEKWTFELMDMTGRVVHREGGRFNSGSNQLRIQRNNWPEGMYLYRLQVGETMNTGRLIVRNGL